MGILGNIVKAFKGGASEVGEAIVDANAVRILEQEIREADQAIHKAKQSLTQLKATEIKLKREVSSLAQDIADYEAKAIQALEQGKEDLAREVAERIADIEAEHNDKAAEFSTLKDEVSGINNMIRKREQVIQKNKRELDKIKTVEQLQKTTAKMSTNFAATGNSQHRVSDALDRVKAKQQNWRDKVEAGQWMEEQASGSDLDNKLKAEGIGETSSGADDILARLKAKK